MKIPRLQGTMWTLILDPDTFHRKRLVNISI